MFQQVDTFMRKVDTFTIKVDLQVDTLTIKSEAGILKKF